MSAIVTVTPAAAIDRTYHLAQLRLGDVNRASAVSTELSGKGVNVARAAALGGRSVSAVLPLGADTAELTESTSGELLAVVAAGPRTRVNTTLLDSDWGTTKINARPLPLETHVWNSLVHQAESEIIRLDAHWLVLSGTIPQIVESGAMAPFPDLLRMASDRGVNVAVDTAGAALETAARHLELVTLLKPNTHELAELTGRPLSSFGDVEEAAAELHRAGCDVVYVSMGADGAMGYSADGVWHAHAQARARVVNTAGAGDASLAGFLVGSDGIDAIDVPAGLVLAASWGALAVSQATTVLSSLDGAPEVVLIRDPDPDTPLGEPSSSSGATRG